MDKLENRAVVQIGIVVRDVARAARQYAEVFGIPLPEVVEIAHDSFANTIYRGQPSQAKGKAAFFDLGSVQMELIEPVGGPSTWEEFLRAKGEGIHHIAFKVNEMGEALAFLQGRGLEVVQAGGWDGGQYAYLDASAQLGTILELLHFDEE
ncbi:MAG: VOC family protein [Anaerolineales bacterium]